MRYPNILNLKSVIRVPAGMNRTIPNLLLVLVTMVALAQAALRGRATALQKEASLSDVEEDKLRETQDPGERVELYITFAQARLSRFDSFRYKPPDAEYDNGSYLDKVLGEYIAVEDELKNWIDYQYQRQGDMRKGLRVLLDQGPQQLAKLKQIQESSDRYSADYRDSLRDAIDNLTDTLDGATKALADQEKKFGQLKREEKAAARDAKEAAREEKKKMKQEQKLRKREKKHGVPEDRDQD